MYRKAKRVAVLVGAAGALGLGGSAIANATTSTTPTSATSATSATSTTSTTSTSALPPAPPKGSLGRAPSANFPAHGTAAHEDAEKAVTGATATKVQAAAVKIVGSGGTAGAVTTDYQGSGYETTVTKSDGTKVEIHLDSSLQEIGPGMGPMSGHAAGGRGMGAPPMAGVAPSGSHSG